MDLRGIAQVSSNSWVICGGMEAEQSVSKKVYLLEYDESLGLPSFQNRYINAYFQNNKLYLDLPENDYLVNIYTISGQIVGAFSVQNKNIISLGQSMESGLYLIQIKSVGNEKIFTTKAFHFSN